MENLREKIAFIVFVSMASGFVMLKFAMWNVKMAV